MNNDLISREELKKHKFIVQICNGVEIEDVEVVPVEAIDNAPTAPLPDFKEGYKQAIIDGKTNFSRTQGEWIPVSERLPERNKEVIVTDIETEDTYCSLYLGNGYWECDNGTFKNRIIAWQPLPEPYEKGGAE